MPDISPLYFTVGPNGEVGAVFPGGIKIFGEEAIRSYNPIEQAQRRVTWVREEGTNDAVIAHLRASYDPDLSELQVHTSVPDGALNMRANLYLGAADIIGGLASVTAEAGGPSPHSRTIIDQNGESDFLQGPPYYVRARSGGPQSVGVGTTLALPYSVVESDEWNRFNGTQYFCAETGVYHIAATTSCSGTNGGVRVIWRLHRNNLAYRNLEIAWNSGGEWGNDKTMVGSTLAYGEVGDFFDVRVVHNDGVARSFGTGVLDLYEVTFLGRL